MRKAVTEREFILESIPHKFQRYRTVGDWTDKKPSRITVSKMGNKKMEFLVLLHELVECFLCTERGITDKEVTTFDKMFEKERDNGLHADKEPGFDKRAPYRREHTFATRVEKIVAKELGVDWKQYSEKVDSL